MADVLRVCALYPDLMNIYADRGNLALLRKRCGWRGLGFELSGAGLGDPLDPDAHDLFYIGGGQDRDQALCAEDLITLFLVTPGGLAEEAAAHGLEAEELRHIPETPEHVAGEVVVFRG